MTQQDPIRNVFLIVGLITLMLVGAAGLLSNWHYERQFAADHTRQLQDNAELAASILARIPRQDRQLALQIVHDLLQTWDSNAAHRHRIVVLDSRGSELLVFPYNIGVLAHSAEAEFPDGSLTLYTTGIQPDYPSQITVLAALGVLLIIIIGTGMQIAGRSLQLPMKALATAAEHFASGDLSYRTTPDSHPLVGGVASTMNQMAEQLESRIATIDAQRQELEALFSSMIEGIIVLTPDVKIQRMNQVAGQFFSTDPATAEHKPLLQIVRNSELAQIVQDVLVSGAPSEYEITVFGNEQRTLQVQATRYESVHTDGILLVLHDISEIRRLETVRRDFVANVSHELKTPITSISGFTETILDDPQLPAEQRNRFIQIIFTQSQRLQAIIEDLLSLSRIEEHGRELPRSFIHASQLIDTVLHMCSHAAKEKNIAIAVDVPGTAQLYGNSNLLEQALTNLVQNAIKYSAAGSRVQIAAHPTQSACFQFIVQDTGAGIPQQDLPRLFERFYRVDRARSRELGGTGLGLAIVKHIALVHKGTIEVKSTLGKGSTFTLSVPLQD